MQVEKIPVSFMIDSYLTNRPKGSRVIKSNHKKYYLKQAHLLQESYTVYEKEMQRGICFVLRDYGVRRIEKIGLGLVIETKHHSYEFNETWCSVVYENDNQFRIHIVDLQRIPIENCYLTLRWVKYTKSLELQAEIITTNFVRPSAQELASFRRIDEVMQLYAAENENESCERGVISEAWENFEELVFVFTRMKELLKEIKEKHSKINLEGVYNPDGNRIILVPISCYFDKGFYSAALFVQDYPIVNIRMSGGKSAIQCVIGVDQNNIDLLLYLYYCTIEQRNYYQYLNEEQVFLKEYLEKAHPVMMLRNLVQELEIKYEKAAVVQKAKVFLDAKKVVEEYFIKIKELREKAYEEQIKMKYIHGAWVNEFKLFTLVRVLFPDAMYQYTSEWLGNQSVDVYIPSANCVIEYQGQQHYDAVDYFGGEEGLLEREASDQIKREKCYKQGVTLIEWPYLLKIDMPTVCGVLERELKECDLNEQRVEQGLKEFTIGCLKDLYFGYRMKSSTKVETEKRTNGKKAKTHEIRQYDADGKYIASYSTVAEAAKISGLSVGGIGKVIYGERKTAGGFKWKRCLIDSPKEDEK